MYDTYNYNLHASIATSVANRSLDEMGLVKLLFAAERAPILLGRR